MSSATQLQVGENSNEGFINLHTARAEWLKINFDPELSIQCQMLIMKYQINMIYIQLESHKGVK